MERSTTTPDEFLASLPDGTRQDMEALDAALAPVFAGHERVLCGGACLGREPSSTSSATAPTRTEDDPARPESGSVVGIAAQKGAYSLYVNAAEDGQNLMKREGANSSARPSSAVRSPPSAASPTWTSRPSSRSRPAPATWCSERPDSVDRLI